MRAKKGIRLSLRTLLLAALLLAAIGVELPASTSETHYFFLLDLSASVAGKRSAEGLSADNAREMIRNTARYLKENDSSTVILFGKNAIVGAEKENLIDSLGTDIASAIETALSFPADKRRREIVLFTDGNDTTGRLDETLMAAKKGGVKISCIPLGNLTPKDMRIVDVAAPQSVNPSATFDVSVVAESTYAGGAELSLARGGETIQRIKAQFSSGERKSLLFPAVSADPQLPVTSYSVNIRVPNGDDCGENDTSSFAVRTVQDKISVSYLARKPESRAVHKALAHNPRLRIVDGLNDLFACDLLVLDNEEVGALTSRQREEIRSFVESFGGGLFIIGGDRAFALGGMAETPVEEVSPLWAFPDEQISITFVLDRSGSMGQEIPGRAKIKLSYAKDAIVSSLRFLREGDFVGLISFAETSRVDSPLIPADKSPSLIARLSSLQPYGQTTILPSIEATLTELAKSATSRRHIVMITDGMSSSSAEDMDAFRKMGERMARERVTATVIAVGKDIAKEKLLLLCQKEGDFHHLADISKLEELLKETLARSKELVLSKERPMAVAVERKDHPILAGIDVPPPIRAMNRTSPRKGAEVILSVERTPLLAARQSGLGKCVALASDPSSDWAQSFASWEGFYKFVNQIALFCARDPQRRSARVESTLRGDGMEIDLYTATDGGAELRGRYRHLGGGAEGEITFKHVGVDRYTAILRDPSAGTYLIAVSGESSAMTFAVNFPYPYEYASIGTNRDALRRIASETGGEVVAEIAPIVNRRSAERIAVDGAPYFISLAMLLFLLDILIATFWK